jgi:hypothetical protein
MGSFTKHAFAAKQRSLRASLSAAVVIGLSATAGAVSAQDAPKIESPTAIAAQPESTPQPERRRERRERHRKAEAENAKPVFVASSKPDVEVECRSMTVTGSRVPKQICATHETWEAAATEGNKTAQDLLRRATDQALRGAAAQSNASSAFPLPQ